MTKPTPCERFEERLSSYLLGDLPAGEAAEVKAHLEGCPACQATVRELEPTLAILRETLAAESATAAAPPLVLEPARRLAIRDAHRQPRQPRFRLLNPFRPSVGTEDPDTLTLRRFGRVFLKTAAIFVVLLGILFLLLPSVGGRKYAVPAGSGDVSYMLKESAMPEAAVHELAKSPVMPAPPAASAFAEEGNGRRADTDGNGWADSTNQRMRATPKPFSAVVRPQAQKAKGSSSGKAALGEEVAGLPVIEPRAPTAEGQSLGDSRGQREWAPLKDAFDHDFRAGVHWSGRDRRNNIGMAGGKGLAENGKNAQEKSDRDNLPAFGATAAVTTGAGGTVSAGERERVSRSGDYAAAGPAPAAPEPKQAEPTARPQREKFGNVLNGDGHVSYDGSRAAEGKRLESEKRRASGLDQGLVVNGTATTVTATVGGTVGGGGGAGGISALSREERVKAALQTRRKIMESPNETVAAKAPATETTEESVPAAGDVPLLGRLFKKSENAPASAPPPASAPQLALASARVVTAPAKPPAPDLAPSEIDGLSLERQDKAKARDAELSATAAPGAVTARRELETAQKDVSGRSGLTDLATGEKLADLKSDKLVAAAGSGVQLQFGNGTAILSKQLEAIEDKPTPPTFETHTINPFIGTAENAFSTFSMDVDTASYTMARRAILEGRRPPPESIRVEEFINSFDYAYQPPTGKAFAIHTQSAASAFRPSLDVLEIGIKASRLGRDQQRRAVLTLLIDTSGSMNTPDRLPLVKRSLKLLVGQLKETDSLAIVQFASKATLVLEPTPASERARILEAIDNLQTAGSTHLEAGMRLAYETAARAFVSGGSNRVLLLSDGVANLGAGSADSILKAVEAFRKQGIYLSVFGFGSGSYNDAMLQNLADKGDGAYVFIDSLDEAKRVLVDDLTATLNVMASDAKIQVEFNPKRVARYRQVGYEKRQLTKEQFRDDSVDAAEIGSGQSVTALYELELQGNSSEPVGVVRVRYRNTETGQIEEIEQTITSLDRTANFAAAPVRYRLAAGVAEFAEVLRGSPYVAGTELGDVAKVLRPVALELRLDAHIQELLRLAQTAASLPGN